MADQRPVLGIAVSPLCPNHVLFCHSVQKGENTKTDLNTARCLVDITTPQNELEAKQHGYVAPVHCNRCVKSFQSKTNGPSCVHLTTNYKSRLQTIRCLSQIFSQQLSKPLVSKTTPFQRRIVCIQNKFNSTDI